MKNGTLLGLTLMVIGFLALAYQGFTYTSRHGSVSVESVGEHNPLPLFPAFGAIAMFAGFVLVVREKERNGKRGL